MAVNTSTMAIARVSKLPHIGTPKERPIKTLELPFTLIPEPTPKSDVVPLWVVVVSACAGAIILLLLVYLLYKVSKATSLMLLIHYSRQYNLFYFVSSVVSSREIVQVVRQPNVNHCEMATIMGMSICRKP